MNAKMIWIHVGLLALFATGVAVGVLYHHHVMHPQEGVQRHGGHPTDEHSQFVDQFRKRLDLTDEQTAKVRDILDGLHKEMMGLSKEFRDKFNTTRGRAWENIRAMLSEKQRLEFEKLVEELEKRSEHH